MAGRAKRPAAERDGWDDARLVQACRDGDEEAWAVLIERYRRLIYSIAVRYGAQPADAADIFQAVCLEWYAELPKLRKVESLRSWLISVATHEAFRWKQRVRRLSVREGSAEDAEATVAAPPQPDLIEMSQREQTLRDAVQGLPVRCREMVTLLFFSDPPLPYAEVARTLGLATGSIGFIRGRCLKKLQRALQAAGFDA
jgi:RNA polymerase sigma factor (sigma-70 family)